MAVNFLFNDFSGEFHNIIFYEIEIDENTNGLYISSPEYFFNNIPLAWPHEKQILLANKLKLKVIDASWSDELNNRLFQNKNILTIKCKGYHI